MFGILGKCSAGLVLGVLLTVVTVGVRANSPATGKGLIAFGGGRYAEAARDWQQAAESGDGQAALYMGLMYDLGRGVVPDMQAARSWYERAAKAGNAVAMFNIGVLYDAGIGVPRDRALSLEWYRKAAALGMGRAAYALGSIYADGDGVAPDRNQAVLYFRQALASGATAARARLAALGDKTEVGRAGNSGLSSAKDTDGAPFERAQELLLGRTPQAKTEAAALFRQAADQGDLLAAYDLAYCYEHGIGLQVDRRQAAFWYGRAAGSSISTVQQAARTGMQAIYRTLSPSDLAALDSELKSSSAGQ